MQIASIIGGEPQRPGEDPEVYALGFDGVTSITEFEQNLGTYAIVWFEVRNAAGDTIAKMNGLHVATVRYHPSS